MIIILPKHEGIIYIFSEDFVAEIVCLNYLSYQIINRNAQGLCDLRQGADLDILNAGINDLFKGAKIYAGLFSEGCI